MALCSGRGPTGVARASLARPRTRAWLADVRRVVMCASHRARGVGSPFEGDASSRALDASTGGPHKVGDMSCRRVILELPCRGAGP